VGSKAAAREKKKEKRTRVCGPIAENDAAEREKKACGRETERPSLFVGESGPHAHTTMARLLALVVLALAAGASAAAVEPEEVCVFFSSWALKTRSKGLS
jgi:hypothetical protein